MHGSSGHSGGKTSGRYDLCREIFFPIRGGGVVLPPISCHEQIYYLINGSPPPSESRDSSSVKQWYQSSTRWPGPCRTMAIENDRRTGRNGTHPFLICEEGMKSIREKVAVWIAEGTKNLVRPAQRWTKGLALVHWSMSDKPTERMRGKKGRHAV